MVDFRYHLVSLVAVFLALAVGVVVGTTALNGPVLDDLNHRLAGLRGDNRSLEAQLRTAQHRSADQDAAAALLTPTLVHGALAGQRVVLVSTPDAPAGLRDGLVPLLQAAGAEVGATVRLRPALLDPASSQKLDDLVAQVAVPGATVPDGEPVDQAVAQLSQVLLTRPGTAAPRPETVQRVLAAYQSEDLVDVEGAAAQPATLALLLTGDPATAVPSGAAGDALQARERTLVELARALDVHGSGTVVAGSAAAVRPGGLLAALRDDSAATDRVSSVDAADTPTGRLGVVLALREQQAGGSGSYGSGTGVDGPLPSPVPSPAAS
ncbi:MAG: hypothetical protein JWN17_601 [Frankiales bacterium]|nr:hypothetical protein [Frankiales bacterium]